MTYSNLPKHHEARVAGVDDPFECVAWTVDRAKDGHPKWPLRKHDHRYQVLLELNGACIPSYLIDWCVHFGKRCSHILAQITHEVEKWQKNAEAREGRHEQYEIFGPQKLCEHGYGNILLWYMKMDSTFVVVVLTTWNWKSMMHQKPMPP